MKTNFKRLAGMTCMLLVATGIPAQDADTATAIFAGGCFWCTESDFEALDGIISAVSGYTDGHVDNPTYRQVTTGQTGHTEAVEVTYDPAVISYAELVEFFWRTIDPTQANAQFCDHGSQYRSAIYYQDDAEKKVLEDSLAALEASKPFDDPIVTEVRPRQRFWIAEDYHQDYYKKSATRYKLYRYGCGRDARLKALWGDQAAGG